MFRNHMIRDHVALSGPKGGECLQLVDASVTFFFSGSVRYLNDLWLEISRFASVSALWLRPTDRRADRSAESTDRLGGPTDPSDWPTDRTTDRPPDRPVAARLSRWTDPIDQPSDQQATNETGRPS